MKMNKIDNKLKELVDSWTDFIEDVAEVKHKRILKESVYDLIEVVLNQKEEKRIWN